MQFINEETYKKDIQKVLLNIPKLEYLKNKTILITGATGLIASVITDILRTYNKLYNANVKLFLTSRNIKKLKSMYGEEDKGIVFLENDLLNINEFPNDVDYLIHSASIASPNLYTMYPVETVESNVVSTMNLMKFYKDKALSNFTFVSSGEVYGEVEDDSITFTEDMVGKMNSLTPRSSYPISKLMSENICIDYSKEYNIQSVIVRPSHVYGPNYKDSDMRAASYFLNQGIEKKEIIMKSEGLQKRSFTYVLDAASGILAATILGKDREAYNVSNTDNAITMKKFAEIIAEKANVTIKMELSDSKNKTTHAVLDNSNLKSLGWKPIFDNSTGITHSLICRRNINNE